MTPFKQIFAQLLTPHLPELSVEEIINFIEVPPQGLWADLAFPCFSLAKTRGQSPVQISGDIANTIQKTPNTNQNITSKWPYINISFDPLFVIEKIKEFNTHNSTLSTPKGLVLIESPSPNTNKPLHLGHVRNMVLGNVLARSMTHEWYDIQKVEVVNDRGIHICKSMLAYKLWGNNAEPDKKSDHYVGDWYVRYASEEEKNPELKEQAQSMLRDREDGDPEVRALWKKMNKRAIDGMRETYTRYWTHIDDATFESDVYQDGKEVAEQGLAKGVFVRDPKGNIALLLPINEEETSYFVVLRSDGTTLYATQDLALVDKRFKTYHMDKMVYVVGNEQDDYFRALFKCFKALDYPFASQCHHLSYGMIELPNGKMKSRTWNVIDADNLIEELHQVSVEEITKRNSDLDERTAHERAEKIALWAINFFMIKTDPAKWFVFDPAESLSFEGETGPYIQYTYARIWSIITKVKELGTNNQDEKKLGTNNQDEKELETTKQLYFHLWSQDEIISKSNTEYKPSTLARYTLDLCQMINSFYQQYHIINPGDLSLTQTRGQVLQDVHTTLGNMMDILWIPRIDIM